MTLTNKYTFFGSLKTLRLRVVVRRTNFFHEKDILSAENISSESEAEETVINWISAENENEQDRKNKIIGYKFYEKESKRLNSPNTNNRIGKFWNSFRELFMDLNNGVYPTLNENAPRNCRVLKIFLNSDENTHEGSCIWTIKATGNSTLLFDPPISSKGISIHGKFGECKVNLHVLESGCEHDGHFASSSDLFMIQKQLDEPMFRPIENYYNLTYFICLERAVEFEDDGVTIYWEIFSDNPGLLISGQNRGRTPKCFKNSENSYIFSESFAVTVLIPKNATNTFPTLKCSVISEDSWGRQCLEGVSSTILVPYTTKATLEMRTWTTHSTSSYEELQHFFLGNLSNTYSKTSCKAASGKIHYTVSAASYVGGGEAYLAQSFSSNILESWRLKSGLFWKIMKVLLEFEEARRHLLNVNKNK